eukprot:jgi/Chrpa1/4855/Chrysochromulina_OHIO_Genome00010223-RA
MCNCTLFTIVSQLCLGASASQPYEAASVFMISPICAAWCMSFFGMQPTLTQVPPSPHVVPASDGFTKSQTATFLPYLAAALLAARPPEPPPMTSRS